MKLSDWFIKADLEKENRGRGEAAGLDGIRNPAAGEDPVPMGELRSEDLMADLRDDTDDLLMNLEAIVKR